VSVGPPGDAPTGTIDLFEAQDAAARRARWRFALILLCMPLVVAAVNVWIGLIAAAHLADRMPPEVQATLAAEPWRILTIVPREVYAATTAIALAILLNGMRRRRRELRLGSATFATNIRARAVKRDSPFEEERQLINVADEMALAAELLPPALYVLDAERETINAFAFAAGPDEFAVILTQGAVLRLPRAELQALVAYALALARNGDVGLNVRLISWLAGLTAIGAIGTGLMYAPLKLLFRETESGITFGNEGAGDLAKAGCVIGLIFIAIGSVIALIGSVGFSLARWIRVLGARQRVLLADATALQLTRDPAGLTALLQRLEPAGKQRPRWRYGEEIGPLLFVPAVGWRCLRTHPAIPERIAALGQAHP
jgi:Zn-dependent protease with chaperone function